MQYELGQVIRLIIEGKWKYAKKKYLEIKRCLRCSGEFISSKLRIICKHVKDFLEDKAKIEAINKIVELIDLITVWHKHPLALDHNIAISCKHKIMKKIKILCNQFLQLPEGAKFNSFRDLWCWISLENQ